MKKNYDGILWSRKQSRAIAQEGRNVIKEPKCHFVTFYISAKQNRSFSELPQSDHLLKQSSDQEADLPFQLSHKVLQFAI